ncbi:hypothetical protein B9Z55_005800 [Caenorhabditis nigoni]|uniref:PPM-type phosphatase domain-containing protein n=1 Tax=Caenorhabditis nigoni TaxID=1611254 RepID=A0A2G5V2J8_9PELO|nr:hypothetical protein B9Z55_005800 [Caenorhabditis nigoni]
MGEIEHTSWTSIGLDERLEDVAEKVFAIIACDGLWKSFTNVEAVTYASEQLEVAKKMDIQQEPNETREIAELRIVAERLASEAVRRKCGDNVSVIVVKLELIDC